MAKDKYDKPSWLDKIILRKLKAKKRQLKAKPRKEVNALLINYAKGSRGYNGASGSDLKELEKRFGKKK